MQDDQPDKAEVVPAPPSLVGAACKSRAADRSVARPSDPRSGRTLRLRRCVETAEVQRKALSLIGCRGIRLAGGMSWRAASGSNARRRFSRRTRCRSSSRGVTHCAQSLCAGYCDAHASSRLNFARADRATNVATDCQAEKAHRVAQSIAYLRRVPRPFLFPRLCICNPRTTAVAAISLIGKGARSKFRMPIAAMWAAPAYGQQERESIRMTGGDVSAGHASCAPVLIKRKIKWNHPGK